MDTYKAEGIILQTTDFGDANRVVTLFTREFGKLDVNAYGCRRVKSPLAGATQLFNHIKAEISPGTKVDTIREADIVRHWQNLTADLDRLTYTAIFFETVNRMTLPRNCEPNIFYLLAGSLPTLNSRNPRIAALIGISQFIQLSGFWTCPPELEEIFATMLAFDWREETKLTFKPKQISAAEKFLINYVQSIVGKELNSVKFLKQFK